ncbi:hypothetical protein PVAND_008090 [Polypedilum vanderplanki]|uniref:Uncharacterized protein n=1 Tax=Polypedilum vanderplanki TaxID=319348 RepID=A0A9J6C964_POLVA|nr:hypothetical protein PVAND_008090 [Polypedilum vanderplanki]
MPKINIKKKIPLRQTQIKLKTNQILSMQKTIDRSLLTSSGIGEASVYHALVVIFLGELEYILFTKFLK